MDDAEKQPLLQGDETNLDYNNRRLAGGRTGPAPADAVEGI